jgi:hypothetical protein
MCVIACKYLTGIGWVGVKDRDRNYKPVISIIQDAREGVESIFIKDSVTKYSEGINEFGVGILNAATSVRNDESAAAAARRYERERKKSKGTYIEPDGIKIRHALRFKTPKESAEYLASVELRGHTLVFNKEECYILEGTDKKLDFDYNKKMAAENPDHEWEPMEYEFVIKKIQKDRFVVRTNHGNFLPWSGYQKDSDDSKQMFSRMSSETRHNTVIKNLQNVDSIEGMLDAISDTSNEDKQLNPVRTGDYQDRTKLKTTGQLCLIPDKCTLIYRPIWCEMDLSYVDKINSLTTKTFFELKPFRLTENIMMSFKDYQFNYNL